MADLAALIAASYTPADADSFSGFVPSQSDLSSIATAGGEVLLLFKKVPGACAMMSAVYVRRIQALLPHIPVYAVAGSLSIGDQPIFGQDLFSRDWKLEFREANLDWDGHCWVVVGEYIADVSLCRTAYSPQSPPLLTNHITQLFGSGRGLVINTNSGWRREGFLYQPEHVLTNSQIDTLFESTGTLINRTK